MLSNPILKNLNAKMAKIDVKYDTLFYNLGQGEEILKV